MYKRWKDGDLKGAIELQKVLAAADPTVAGLGTCELKLSRLHTITVSSPPLASRE
jgi:hypothetical protein